MNYLESLLNCDAPRQNQSKYLLFYDLNRICLRTIEVFFGNGFKHFF